MPRKIVLSPDDDAKFRAMWAAAEPVAHIAAAFGVGADTVNLLRVRLGLKARTARTRAARRSPAADPTPEEIAAACAELRSRHVAKRLAEPPGRKYRTDDEVGGRIYPSDVFEAEG